MRSDIIAGAQFPDYKLNDHEGVPRSLSELQGDDPMIVVLSRGGFCPKDQRQHEALVQLHHEMEVAYCNLVTISTDDLEETKKFRSSIGAGWTFLSDPERIVHDDLDIAEYTDSRHNPMVPHTVVLEPGLTVYRVYNGYWFFGRPTVEDLRQDLRAITMKIRPDFDICDPELRAEWERGERDHFYPYGRPRERRQAHPA